MELFSLVMIYSLATFSQCQPSDIDKVIEISDTLQQQQLTDLLNEKLTKRGYRADGCNMADIVFLLDSSGSVTANGFNTMKDIVADIANAFDIGPRAVQIGVVTFSSSATTVINLNRYHNKRQLIAGIKNIAYTGDSTNTHIGLSHVMSSSFTWGAGDRNEAKNIVIVITDGKSNDRIKTQREAKKLHNKNIKVIAVGVGGADGSELNNIASASNLVFYAKNFNALKFIESNLIKTACSSDVAGIQCGYKPADIVFLLDSSGSIDSLNFEKMKQFVNSFIEPFAIGKSAVQIAVVSFSNKAEINFDLNRYQDKNQLMAAINSIDYMEGGTNTAGGLSTVMNQSFTRSRGDRSQARNILIVITDGKSNSASDTRKQAKSLHGRSIKVLAVGVGVGLRNAELNDIAGKPNQVFRVDNFDALEFIKDDLRNKACA